MSDEDELRNGLAEIGLGEYCTRFMEEGFDTWATVMSVTESDLDFLQVKLGHRRKLQSAIAESRNRNIPTFKSEGSNNSSHSDPSRSVSQADGQRTKRKYVRHPKPDRNAPLRALSAYVLFAHHVRDANKDQGLTFTDMAKTVGSGWQALPQSEREEYEKRAAADKGRYNAELAQYKESDQYAEYQRYLERFRQEQENKKVRQEPTEVITASADCTHPYRRSPRSTSLEASQAHQGGRDTSGGFVNSPSPASTTSTSIISPFNRTLASNEAASKASFPTARVSQAPSVGTTATTSPSMPQSVPGSGSVHPFTSSSGMNSATCPHETSHSHRPEMQNASPRFESAGHEGIATRQLPLPVKSGPSRGGMVLQYNNDRRTSAATPTSSDYSNTYFSRGPAYLPNPSAGHSYRNPNDHVSALPSLRDLTASRGRDAHFQEPISREPVKSPHSHRMVDGGMTPPPRPSEAQHPAPIEQYRRDGNQRAHLPEPPGTTEALFDPDEPGLYPKQRLSEMRSGPRRSGRDRPN